MRYSNHAQPDLPQVTKLRRCGVGVVNSGHVLQAHGSDALLRLYTDVGYAWISAQAFLGCSNAREQTHRLTPVGRSPCKGDIPVLCKIHTPRVQKSARGNNSKLCITLFADRNRRQETVLPNALHLMCSLERQMISPGPGSKRVDSIGSSAEMPILNVGRSQHHAAKQHHVNPAPRDLESHNLFWILCE